MHGSLTGPAKGAEARVSVVGKRTDLRPFSLRSIFPQAVSLAYRQDANLVGHTKEPDLVRVKTERIAHRLRQWLCKPLALRAPFGRFTNIISNLISCPLFVLRNQSV